MRDRRAKWGGDSGVAKNYETKDAVRPMCYAPKVAPGIKLDENRDSDNVADSDVGGEQKRN